MSGKKRRQYMQESRREVEATGSTRYHKTLLVRIDLESHLLWQWWTQKKGLTESPTLSHFNASDTQVHTFHYYITKVYPVLIHWWVVYAILLFCWSTCCPITLLSLPNVLTMLSYTLIQKYAELNPILTDYWGLPNLQTIVRFIITHYIAAQFPISIPSWAIPKSKTLLWYKSSSYNPELTLSSYGRS